MLVEIRQEHCIGADYKNVYDCPVFRAIREQHPEFPLKRVGNDYIRSEDDKLHYFPSLADVPLKDFMHEWHYGNRWGSATLELLAVGGRAPVLLHIDTPEYDRQQAEIQSLINTYNHDSTRVSS